MTQHRPYPTLEHTPFDRFLEILLGAGVVFLGAIVALSWSRVPAEIPHHFNFAGEVDAWGGKGLLFLFPFLSLLLGLGAWALATIPHRYNYPWPITADNAACQYRLARRLVLSFGIFCTWLFAGMAASVVLVALDPAAKPMRALLWVAVLGPWVILGGYWLRASGKT